MSFHTETRDLANSISLLIEVRKDIWKNFMDSVAIGEAAANFEAWTTVNHAIWYINGGRRKLSLPKKPPVRVVAAMPKTKPEVVRYVEQMKKAVKILATLGMPWDNIALELKHVYVETAVAHCGSRIAAAEHIGMHRNTVERVLGKKATA